MNETREELELIELGEVSEETSQTEEGLLGDGGQFPPEIRKVNP